MHCKPFIGSCDVFILFGPCTSRIRVEQGFRMCVCTCIYYIYIYIYICVCVHFSLKGLDRVEQHAYSKGCLTSLNALSKESYVFVCELLRRRLASHKSVSHHAKNVETPQRTLSLQSQLANLQSSKRV